MRVERMDAASKVVPAENTSWTSTKKTLDTRMDEQLTDREPVSTGTLVSLVHVTAKDKRRTVPEVS